MAYRYKGIECDTIGELQALQTLTRQQKHVCGLMCDYPNCDQHPQSTSNGPGTLQQVACDHGVTFDQVAAAPMTVAEVRAKYPRLDGLCPKGCGFHGIAYKSTAHFVYGDW